MVLCLVVCCDCRELMYGPDPKKIDYRMAVVSGKLRPFCLHCHDKRRTSPGALPRSEPKKKTKTKQTTLF